ncbi:MAG TPA: O-methyltransferase [Solirubrobacteraceae bacterium]|jgi:predicted O-methyltransferase YrrM
MSEQQRWSEVDRFVEDTLLGDNPALEAAAAGSAAAGMPPIAVSPAQGRMLRLLTQIHGAKRVLELGTLGGYSTICFASALPADGRLLSLEANPAYADLARENVARAGYAELVEIRVGPALESLPQIADEGEQPFDLVFIDADKENTPKYFQWALRLVRRGGVILTDNVVRSGEIANPETEDPRARAMRRFHEMLSGGSAVEATTIQTVGSKGYDGFTLARVK